MENISYPYHLIIPAAISLVLLLLTLFIREKVFRKRKILWVSLLVFFSCYLFVCGTAGYDDINIQISSSKLDLNKNGLYEDAELTEEAKKVLSKISNDTGRNFAVITGFIFAFMVSTATFLLGSILRLIFNRKKE